MHPSKTNGNKNNNNNNILRYFRQNKCYISKKLATKIEKLIKTSLYIPRPPLHSKLNFIYLDKIFDISVCLLVKGSERKV